MNVRRMPALSRRRP